MDILTHVRRRAFSLWLRTGRLPRWAKPAASEVKYNPWHDPDDGRFTFKGRGRYFERGSSSSRDDVVRMASPPSDRRRRPNLANNGGGASWSWESTEDIARRRRAELRAASSTGELSGGATVPIIGRAAAR